MKKVMSIAAVLLIGVAVSLADSRSVTAVVTNGVASTNSVSISGYLDKIEFYQVAAHTCSVVVATYDANGTAVDTYLTLSSTTDDNKVIRTRVIGTSNAGTAFTNTYYSAAADTNIVTTMLVAGYEKPMVGGNLKAIITGSGGAGSLQNTVGLTFFYEPIKH